MTKRFLQTEFWAQFKGNHGWKPYFFIETDDDLKQVSSYEETAVTSENRLTVLVRTFSIKLKTISIAYIPMAPEWNDGDDEVSYLKLLELRAALLKPYLPSNTICIRFDPPINYSTNEERKEKLILWQQTAKQNKINIKKTKVDIQPPDTTVIDLSKTEDELLASMKNKWRYNVRLAEKKGVEIEKHYGNDENFEEAFNVFYNLFQQTSERDGVSFHNKNYYVDLLHRGTPDKNNSEKPVITLYLAKHENDYLAGIITAFTKEGEAIYLYGASGNLKRNLMPAYLLQWTAIRDAKSYSCTSYDFYGMPPTDAENHPMHGLYLFKTGFGGAIIHRPGSFDIPLRKGDYRLYTCAENLRAFWHKKIMKKIRGR